MKTAFLSLLIIAIIGLTTMSSCSKYKDGPGLSLRTKKARLTGEWKLYEMTVRSQRIIISSSSIIIEYKKNDSFIERVSIDGESGIRKGKWDFSHKKETIYSTYDDVFYTEKFKITRLTNKELWVKTYNSNKYYYDEMKFEKL